MVQIVMELELSEQSVSPTRLFESSSLESTIAEGHLRTSSVNLCSDSSEAKSDSDLPQMTILKSESYNFMS
jgi:hypothetical protein